jgi:hypothetical protein
MLAEKRGAVLSCRGIRIGLWMTVIISLSFPTTLCATPKLNIKPKFSTSWRADSNLYYAQDTERDVYTYTLQPGVEVGLETAKSALILDYTLDAYFYDDRDTVPPGEQPSDEDDYIGHTGTLGARYQAFDRLALGLNESFHLTRDPGESDEFSNSVDREKYYINRFEPIVLYEFGRKFSAGLKYRHTKIHYITGDLEDSDENRGVFDLIYNFTPKTSLDFEYQHWEKDYDGFTSDYASNQAKLIFRRQFRILNISLGAGYQNRDFDDNSIEDIDEFTYHLNLDGEGTLANRRSYIGLNIAQNVNDQSPGSNYFIATRFILKGGHEFSRKLSGDVRALYQISDYERTSGLTPDGNIAEREDDTYEISGSLNYMFARWMTFSGTAGFEKRDSNLAGLDYENTFFILKLGFTYDLGRK